MATFSFRELTFIAQPLSIIVTKPLLLLERKSRSRQLLDAYLKQHGFSVEPAFELGSTDLLIRFAQYDFGVACVPFAYVEDLLTDGRLVEIRPLEPLPQRHVGAAWLKDMPRTAAAKVLVGMLEDITGPEF